MPRKREAKFYLACYLLLKRRNMVLLSKRLNTGFEDGKYGMVSGHLEGGETVEEAMSREAKEEAGIGISPNDLKVIHIMHRNTPEREYVDFFLTADKWRGEPKNMEPGKCSNLRWFDVDALPSDTIGYAAYAIDKIGKKEFYSEYGFSR